MNASAMMTGMNLKTIRRSLVLVTGLLVLTACGGGADTERLQPNTVPPPSNYNGPPPATADAQNFMNALWVNVRAGGVAGCAACHADTQQPLFARSDDVNLAWEAAVPLVVLDDPAMSILVQKMASGHNCWLGSNQGAIQACTSLMETWIGNWGNGIGDGGMKQIQLIAPPVRNVGSSRNFPADSALFEATVHPVVSEYCSTCHSSASAIQQSPFFADPDPATAYAAARVRMDLNNPANSRLVLRLRNEFHNCWSDCAANADEMEDAIREFAQQVPVTEVDGSLVVSKALGISDGIVASGGSRAEGSQIALWEFKEGAGNMAYDTSGVQPAINLNLTGSISWVGGWGINIGSGRAQASTTTSRKLHDLITPTGEYSVEAWVAPGNVVQEGTSIVSYSGGSTQRNFTMGQTMYSYDFRNRSSASGDAGGGPLFQTAAADEDAQATLQHVVMTYDPINGRRIYVNGQFTGDVDPTAGGTLVDWDNSFAFVLGNEPSGDGQWQGILRLVAIHNRALSEASIQQNFEAGVGEKFFLLFNVSEHVGAADSYLMFEVSQFDSYGYLFNRPTFINLDDTWLPQSPIPIEAMRIGVNGTEATVGQSWRTLDVDVSTGAGYEPGVGQVLSSLGTVIPLEAGPDSDEFFLSFELLGTSANVVIEPAPLPPPPLPDGEPMPDIGIKVFDEINASMAAITGVSPNEPNVKATYSLVKQQLPAIENITTFLASHQVGVAQLAIEYCNALVEDTALRAQVFPGFNFATPAGQAFDTPAERDLIFVPLLARAMGTNVQSQPDSANVRLELDALTADLTACGGSCPADRTRTVVKAVCAATLGSAVTLIQ